jgi:hypothetical protein
MKRTLLQACMAFALSLGMAGAARADVQFSYFAVPEAGSVNPVTPGGTVIYDVYVRELLTNGSAELANAQGGLTGAGFWIGFASGSGGTTISAVAANTNTAVGFGNQVGTNFKQNNATDARLIESANGASNVQFSQVDATTFKALLGTVTLKAGTAGDTTFNVGAYKNAPTTIGGSGQNGNTLFGAADFSTNYDADVTNNAELGSGGGPPLSYTGANDLPFGQFTVSTAAVPEPSSMLLCGFAVIGGGFAAYRRRKVKAATEVATLVVA